MLELAAADRTVNVTATASPVSIPQWHVCPSGAAGTMHAYMVHAPRGDRLRMTQSDTTGQRKWSGRVQLRCTRAHA